MSKIRIGINGFGRIGRQVFRALHKSYRDRVEVVAINDLFDAETNFHLLEYDSVYGRAYLDARIDGAEVTVGDWKVHCFAERDPKQLAWGQYGVDIVVVFRQHDEAGYAVSDQIAAIRRELCRALVGWTPPGASDSLIYEGRSFLHTDRSKAAYAFSFSAVEILGHDTLPATADEAETWQALDLIGLPPLEGVDVDVDLIDPIVDKNLKPDGVGPDGRIEHRLKKDFT